MSIDYEEDTSPITPGEVLLEDFMIPLGISQNRLAREIRVPPGRINDILRKNRTITADTAMRLGAYFGTSPRFWLNLQMDYDLETARRTLSAIIDRDVLPLAKSI
jgi:addiction module HigA family antidote